mmetsp:Transcript_34826/g.87218  ORF Transcript_34826/g.87218 Transcript_34826/m.87218 type:complete len:286 (-) Transcript_34826:21-878(-)
MHLFAPLLRPLPVVVVRAGRGGEVVFGLEAICVHLVADLERKDHAHKAGGRLVPLVLHPLPRVAQELGVEHVRGVVAPGMLADVAHPFLGGTVPYRGDGDLSRLLRLRHRAVVHPERGARAHELAVALSDAMVEADDDVVPVDLLAVLGLEQGAAVPHHCARLEYSPSLRRAEEVLMRESLLYSANGSKVVVGFQLHHMRPSAAELHVPPQHLLAESDGHGSCQQHLDLLLELLAGRGLRHRLVIPAAAIPLWAQRGTHCMLLLVLLVPPQPPQAHGAAGEHQEE